MLRATRVFQKPLGPAWDRNNGPTLLGQKSLGPAGGRFNLPFAPDDVGVKSPGPCRRATPPALLPLTTSVRKCWTAGGQRSDPR